MYMVNIEICHEDYPYVYGPIKQKMQSWVILNCAEITGVKLEFSIIDGMVRAMAYFEDIDEMKAFKKAFADKED